MWTPVVISGEEKPVPVSRSKHGAVLHGQYIYLLGGRNGNLALKDFWRYNIDENQWEELKGGGDRPGGLQEHSMVVHGAKIYVFGGEISFSNAAETPLWIYDIQESTWTKFSSPKGVVTPKGRRSHTAIVFQECMYIYGGYQDLRGSTAELWAFHFPSETWHLVSQGGSLDGPPARHRHTAVLHDGAMWVFGGMTDLNERQDCWKFDLVGRTWRPVRSKPGPGFLHSHSAVKFLNSMLLFGGEREGQTLNELWKFHFATEVWERLGTAPPGTTSASQQQKTTGNSSSSSGGHSAGGWQSGPGSQMNGGGSQGPHQWAGGGGGAAAQQQVPHPRAQSIALVFTQFRCGGEVRYMERPAQDYFSVSNTTTTSSSGTATNSSFSSSFSSSVKTSTVSTPKLSRPFRAMARLKEEAESVLDNRTEGKKYKFLSADTCCDDDDDDDFSDDIFDSSGENQLIESSIQNLSKKSADSARNLSRLSRDLYRDLTRPNQFQRLNGGDQTAPTGNASTQGPGTKLGISASTTANSTTATTNNNNNNHQSILKPLARFNNESTESLVESTSSRAGSQNSLRLSRSSSRLNTALDQDDDFSGLPRDPLSVPNFQLLNLNSSSDPEDMSSELSNPQCFLPAGGEDVKVGAPRSDSEFTFQSYDCSSRSSTLPSSRNCPSSRLLDLGEEDGEELSSMSGYESLEAVNILSEPPIIRNASLRMSLERSNGGLTAAAGKPLPTAAGKQDSLGLVNPHYSGPSVEETEEERHSRYAEALKSPTDDQPSAPGRPEMRRPQTTTGSSCQVELRTRPRSEFIRTGIRTNPYKSGPSESGETDGRRPRSCDQAIIGGPGGGNKVAPTMDDLSANNGDEASSWAEGQLIMDMYILGGREVGQVTVFKRPLSIWKLDLTSIS